MQYYIVGYNKKLLQKNGKDVWEWGIPYFKTADIAKALAVYTNAQEQTQFDCIVLWRNNDVFAEFNR